MVDVMWEGGGDEETGLPGVEELKGGGTMEETV